MDDLITIRRSTASLLVLNEAGQTLSLRTMMPVHEVKTVELTMNEEEAAEIESQ